MTRTRVPADAKILVEVGTPRPTETSFDARCPFSVCWVITDGQRKWKYLWINRRDTGLYVAHTLPGGFHESYHSSGQRHWADASGNRTALPQGPPLDAISGHIPLGNRGSNISTESLSRSGISEYNEEPIDKVIYLDNRTFGPWVNSTIFLVEPYKHGDIPMHTRHPCFYYLITHTNPWLVVTIYD